MLKVIGRDMLPPHLSYAEQFAMAARAGFTHVEMTTVPDRAEAETVRCAAEAAGIKISGLIALMGRAAVLLAGPPKEIEHSIAVIRRSIENAVEWSASTVIIIPGRVEADSSFEEGYARSQSAIRESVLPYAEAHGITLAIESTWYGFLLTPTDYARYIDEFESPFVRANLDVGNMIFGHPHHWIPVLGDRIANVHLKDFRMNRSRWGVQGTFSKLGDGAIDWRSVRRAFARVGYDGAFVSTATPPPLWSRPIDRIDRSRRRGMLPPVARTALTSLQRKTYESFLADLSRRFDRFYALT